LLSVLTTLPLTHPFVGLRDILCVSVVNKSLRVLRASMLNALLSRRQYLLEVVLDHMEQVDTRRVSGDAVGLSRIHHQFELLA
jgi:hypothetical protein